MKPYFITCKEAMEARLLLQVSRPTQGRGRGDGPQPDRSGMSRCTFSRGFPHCPRQPQVCVSKQASCPKSVLWLPPEGHRERWASSLQPLCDSAMQGPGAGSPYVFVQPMLTEHLLGE